jgi:hypothetical protein
MTTASSQGAGSSVSYGSSPLIPPMHLLTKGVMGNLPELPSCRFLVAPDRRGARAPLAWRPLSGWERRFLKPLSLEQGPTCQRDTAPFESIPSRFANRPTIGPAMGPGKGLR